MFRRKDCVHDLIKAHFKPLPPGRLNLTERQFPHRVRADLQRAVERLFDGQTRVRSFCGVFKPYSEGEAFVPTVHTATDCPATASPRG